MSTVTKIEWSDRTWNPLVGCERVSPGCDRCYAMGVARVREYNPNPKIAAAFAGTTTNDGGVDWSGTVNLLDNRLTEPLGWKKPARVFVNSMSDLFHAAVPDVFVAQVFAVMAATPQHTYQLLTKRHARMRALLRSERFRDLFEREFLDLTVNQRPDLAQATWTYPLPNLWLGVSVENQQWADTRIPALLDTPAAVRWISAEPLLGPIDLWGPMKRGHRPRLTYWLEGRPHWGDEHMERGLTYSRMLTGPRLNWVVVGGESGPGARPMHPDWARTIRNQCVQSGVPFLFKQWGQWGPMAPLDAQGRFDFSGGHAMANDGTLYAPGDIDYPDGPRYGEALRADHGRANLTSMYRLGKTRAGRELDGRTWDQYPADGAA